MTASESRLAGSFKGLASVAGWFVLSVAALTGCSIAVAWMVTFVLGSAGHVDNGLVGLAACLAALLIASYCHLRKVTVQLRISDRDRFQSRMQVIFQDLGYDLVTMTDQCWRTRPQFRAVLFGDGITMKLAGSKAAITGPRLSLELIRRRYRLANQLDNVQQSLSDSKTRSAETYLKRLELSVRLEPKHMNDFQAQIVDRLAENGQVLVDVQLMLISEEGMNESLWTNEMRPWLETNRVAYEFHPHRTQRSTIAASAGELGLESCIDTWTWS